MAGEPFIRHEIRAYLDEIADRPPPPRIGEVPAPTVRAAMREMLAPLNAGGPEMAETRDLTLAGAFGPRPARLYRPQNVTAPAPALVYFHGGGWVVGDLDTEDRKLRHLAEESDVVILSVDYVLAPEHRFPEPLDDVAACARDAVARAGELELDPERVALGGASAGANLALAAALRLRQAGPSLAALVLFYGVYDLTYGAASHETFAEGYFLETERMKRFRELYGVAEADWTAPDASPLYGELAGLPPTFLNAAALDPLLDDTVRLAAKMRAAGVDVDERVYDGVIHGFTIFMERFACAREAVSDAAAFLRRRLASAP